MRPTYEELVAKATAQQAANQPITIWEEQTKGSYADLTLVSLPTVAQIEERLQQFADEILPKPRPSLKHQVFLGIRTVLRLLENSIPK